MTKSELIELLTKQQPHLEGQDVELAINAVLRHMTEALAAGARVEIRGFGSFSLRFRSPRIGRNPRTGEPVSLEGKYVPYFRPGKEMRDRVSASALATASTSRGGGHTTAGACLTQPDLPIWRRVAEGCFRSTHSCRSGRAS
jgi:integration host factor subunit beta